MKNINVGMSVYLVNGWKTEKGPFDVLDIDPMFEKKRNPNTAVFKEYWAYALLSNGEWVRCDSLQEKEGWEQYWKEVRNAYCKFSYRSDLLPDSEELSPHQVARVLKIRIETVHALARRGALTARRHGKSWRFKRSDILELITPI